MIGRFFRGAIVLVGVACIIQHRYALSLLYFGPWLLYHAWRRIRVVFYDA